MPIRLLQKNGKPWAYTWGWRGHKYLIKDFGVKGAQAKAAYASGYKGGKKHDR